MRRDLSTDGIFASQGAGVSRVSGRTHDDDPRWALGSETSTPDQVREVMRRHGRGVRKAPPFPVGIEDADAPSRIEVRELHFDDGSTYSDGIEVRLDDPDPTEWQAMRGALAAFDLWEYPDARTFLALP
jgi:hypothetical protein